MRPRTQVAGVAPSARPAVLPNQQPDTLGDCRRCSLWRDATQGVPGAGPARARILVIGEQPGNQEDLAGLPFVGPAGHMLDEAFRQAGIARREVFLTNAVKHFKWEARGKRRIHKTPAQREIEACDYWLEKELKATRAKVIVALGATALKAVLHRKSLTLKTYLGTPVECDGRLVVATYHPSYVLRIREEAAREAAFARIVEALRTAKSLPDGR